MRYGMNLFLWTDVLTDALRPLLDDLKGTGFDVVELPLLEIDVAKYAKWGKYLDDAGLTRTANLVRGANDNPISSDPKIRRRGIDANKAALECCQAAGIELLVGPYHSAIGCFSSIGPTAEEWHSAVEGMREVAEYAEVCKVTLAVEYLNRFECYLLNTAADTARFCHDVNHPRCKAMYDTFHAHIEEKDISAAVSALKASLVHVHISENDRSTPGTGQVDWDATFSALEEIGYDNVLMIEAFGLALDRLLPATKIWRRMYQNERQLASDGLAFVKREVAKRWHAERQIL
jgi:D-psicose/D-tagatose/L-ribulose 3-epimerase